MENEIRPDKIEVQNPKTAGLTQVAEKILSTLDNIILKIKDCDNRIKALEKIRKWAIDLAMAANARAFMGFNAWFAMVRDGMAIATPKQLLQS